MVDNRNGEESRAKVMIFLRKKMSCLFRRPIICFRSPETINRARSLCVNISRWLSGFGIPHAVGDNVATEGLATCSKGIKIPRFLRKVKDKEQIKRYCLVKNLCRKKNFDLAVCHMKKWLEEEPVTKSTILTLNGLLHCLYEQGKIKESAVLKQTMDARNISGDRSTYTVLIDGFGKMKNAKMVSELLAEMISLGLAPHERSYMVAAKLAIERNAFFEAFSYFGKIEGVYKEIHDDFCAWFIARLVCAKQSYIMQSVLHDFKKSKARMGEKTMSALRTFFESASSEEWNTKFTKISSSGMCKKCQRKLEEPNFGKQEESLESYFRCSINSMFKGEMMDQTKALSENDLEIKDDNKVKELTEFLKNNGPFNVVVDGLNVAMHPSNGLDFHPLSRLVEYFTNQGKRVLVVAANDLISPKKSKNVSVVEHQKAMMHLRAVADVYLVKQSQSGIDDLVLIYAALCSCREQTDVVLVSNDKFMDHRFKMKPQTASDFNRWLHAHQVMIKGYDRVSRVPRIQPRPNYAFTVQSTQDSWHFPSTDNKTWLCVQRK